MDYFIKPVFAQPQPVADIATEFDLSYGDLSTFVSNLNPLVFSVAAVMVMFYFIIGAFELITSQGDKAHIVSARAKIYHSIIGFILLIAIFLIMQYLPQARKLEGFSLF